MNKRAAQAAARTNTRSVEELRALISAARGRGGMSKVNPQFTLEQVLDILERALAGRRADDIPAGMVVDLYSSTGRMKPSLDSLMIGNILRECT